MRLTPIELICIIFVTILVSAVAAGSANATGFCGDGSCNNGESCSTCRTDCGSCQFCGDGSCNNGETCSSCRTDCGSCQFCGDGSCNNGETCSSCRTDCGSCQFCGDGSCNNGETCSSCRTDCGSCQFCGDGSCNNGETCSTCATDCGSCQFCGDGSCNNGETCSTCSTDCGSCCGNGVLNTGEACERPSTNNNAYCTQSTESCSGAKVATRPDTLGNCNSACGCVSDPLSTYTCVAGKCGAACSAGQTDTQACGSNVGECRQGTQTRTCTESCSWGSYGTCTGSVGPTTEICDGKDNDCDGQIDEGLTESCGSGTCAGTKTCSNGVWGACNSDGKDAGTCAKCTSSGDIIYDPTQNSDCNDGQYCDGQETCKAIGQCNSGTPVTCGDSLFCTVNERCDESLDRCVSDPKDCSGNNKPVVQTCTNIPDGNPLTWDYANGFTSVCSESQKACTSGTYTFTHQCSISKCGAECETDANCDDGNSRTADTCTSSCTCQHTSLARCGDLILDPGEECEGPGWKQDTYCPQSETTCSGNKTGTRPGYGDCGSSCQCVTTPFTNFICKAGSCGATCSAGDTQTQACGSDVGECRKGIQTRTCTDGCGWSSWGQCVGGVGPATEVCDNKDNDCDGAVDESLTQQCGTGVCSGTKTCSAGVWSDCTSAEHDAGICAKCTAAGQLIYDPTQVSDCDNGRYCDGQESCRAIGQCNSGAPIQCGTGLFCSSGTCDESTRSCKNTARDCSAFNLPDIATCNNNPDSNPLTWDTAAGFTSSCDEAHQTCTKATYDLTSKCSKDKCGAQCESDAGCIAGHTCSGCVCTCTASTEICDGKDNDCDDKIDEDNVCGPKIISTPTKKMCLEHADGSDVYTYQVEATDPDDPVLTYGLVENPDTMTIDSSTGLITWTLTEDSIGTAKVVVKAEDQQLSGTSNACLDITEPVCAISGDTYKNTCELEAAGQGFWHDGYCYDMQAYQLEICKPGSEIYPRRKLPIESLELVNDDPVCSGDDVSVILTLQNEGIFDSKDVKITYSIPELGLTRTQGPFRLDAQDGINKRIDISLPEGTPAGMYDLRVYIYSDSGDFHRIKHRDFWVKTCQNTCDRVNLPSCALNPQCSD